MKTKPAVIIIAILLVAYFVFNTAAAYNWLKSKTKSKTTEQTIKTPINRISLSVNPILGYGAGSYMTTETHPIYAIEEREDTLLVLKEGWYEIKKYVEVKDK
jgi:hypothetical protein